MTKSCLLEKVTLAKHSKDLPKQREQPGQRPEGWTVPDVLYRRNGEEGQIDAAEAE